EVALAEYGDDFAEHFQRRRGHHIAEQLDEVCLRRIAPDNERALTEIVENWAAAFDIGRRSGSDDVQLARFGGVRISEHGRRDIALAIKRMLARKFGRGGGADR